MERYVEVMKQSTELMATIEEGIDHIRFQLNEGKYEQSILLFEDVLVAYVSVEKSLSPLVTSVETESISSSMQTLKENFEQIVVSFEQKQYGKVKEIIQFTVLPMVQKVRKQLEQAFNQYLIS
ncbi:hypothetical protein [Bacillus solitudinis]|uniref:hypothetical protein n=1 Tax=Bacillus solitudinis TaxID=2014074 RepID=UPI000C249958|nr:hypothetical protein [Bacillus solitudinis]